MAMNIFVAVMAIIACAAGVIAWWSENHDHEHEHKHDYKHKNEHENENKGE